ncbi:helix-turn-helix domain-containing protein [Pseudomonas helleri]|uniref:Helix-turn-helix transcriptional regulator n=1 Tax=Pseudomonas helleri TaxID=1608996 RepID=A0A6A7ZDW9_9PSED|nr:helix-turn-helix transcriptional regulator [Pseudomonas helleri]KMN16360.1 LuxR family transcriptional regulator [Pseudomonas helleri]MQU08373.1 helix-turn-helix transcriptional regulator [Pseudomonas helleri]MQU60551.1 helix-turn-helix transcriptional regulator [Pseudomonas helleri]
MHQPQSASSGQSTYLQPDAQTKENPLNAIKLTPKEREVLAWGAQGKTSWEIALILKCTESGVNFHFSNIRLKFGVSSRSAALIKATALGLVTPF